jgi:flagellar basal-body rod protein FlgC
MNLAKTLRVSATGLQAERMRMDVISANIANANSVQSPDEEAYRRREVILTGSTEGAKVERIAVDPAPLRRVAEPGHPFADAEGYVYYSNVEPVKEMVNMMGANRAYEANIAAFNAAKTMIRSALQIGKV